MSLNSIPWQGLIITSSVMTSIGQIFNKAQVHKAASLQVSTYKYLSATSLITLIWWFTNGAIPKLWYFYLLYGVVTGITVTLYTKASRHSLSKSALMTPINQMLTIALAAIFLKEWWVFDLSKSGGIQMALGLSLMPILMGLFYEKTAKAKQWSMLMLLIIGALSIAQVLQKVFLNTIEPVQLLLFQYWGSLGVNLMGLRWKGHKFFIGKKFALTGLTQGTITSTAILLYFTGLKKTTVAQAGLLRSPVLIILTTIFGLIIFKEIKNMTMKKWLGIGVALLMAILVVTANH